MYEKTIEKCLICWIIIRQTPLIPPPTSRNVMWFCLFSKLNLMYLWVSFTGQIPHSSLLAPTLGPGPLDSGGACTLGLLTAASWCCVSCSSVLGLPGRRQLKPEAQSDSSQTSGPITSWQIGGGKNGKSDRLYFLGLQNHCGGWLQPWN